MRSHDRPPPDTSPRPAPKYRKCTTCKDHVPTGRVVNGQCPDCAGLVALPLRGEGGRFLPGLTDRRPGGAR